MRFVHPFWMAIFLVVALLVLVLRARRDRKRAVDFSSLKMVEGLPVTWAQRLKRLLPVVQFLGLAALALALARPQEGKEETRLRTEGIAIEMTLDRSGSMAVLDCALDDRQMDRLAAVKRVFRDFVRGDGGELPGRPDDLIGLVAFGGYADSKCPLTIDHGALLEILEDLDIPFHTRENPGKWPVRDPRLMQSREDAAELATAIGEAIAVAADRLKEVEARSRVLILLSDGGESVANQGDPDAPMPQEAARVAAALGIKIYTIAFGSDQMQLPLAVPDRFGGVQIQHVHASRGFAVDEKLLREVAEIGQGKFFRATSTDALRDVYAEIDRLEKTKTEGITFVEYRELYIVPLLVGLGLLLLHLLAVCTRFRTLP
jgi:Ca-activated chloride channel homolog